LKLFFLRGDGGFKFLLFVPQHGLQPGERQVIIQQLGDVIQRQSQFFEAGDAVETGCLFGEVITVAGIRIDRRRTEQANFVIVAQCGYRYLTEFGKQPNPEH
jgi:hypothetical protein